jgi:hypothetical protein
VRGFCHSPFPAFHLLLPHRDKPRLEPCRVATRPIGFEARPVDNGLPVGKRCRRLYAV